MTKQQQLTGAALYREMMRSRTPEIVDVTAPSGFTFKMEKPNALGFALSGNLPAMMANGAVESWTAKGVLPKGDNSDKTDNTNEILRTMLKLRDMVLKLSHSPRIVQDAADPEKDELSVDEIHPDDLTFLLMWVAQGGEANANSLATFPQRPAQNAASRSNGKKLRIASK